MLPTQPTLEIHHSHQICCHHQPLWLTWPFFPSKYHNVPACNAPDVHPWKLWSSTIQPCQAPQALLLLQGAQISICAIPCSWWGGNAKACFVVCWLQHCRALRNPAWVHWCDHILPIFYWCCMQAVSRIWCRAMLVDSGHGQVSRRNLKDRDFITCWLREVLQRVHHHYHFSYHKELYCCCCAFTCGFLLELCSRVCYCLQIKFHDHFPNDPYTLEQIHNTACFVLHSTTSFSPTLDDPCTPTPTIAPAVKAEPTLSTLINIMRQAITGLDNQSTQVSHGRPSAPHNLCCHFHRGDHFKNSCEILKQYICDGKCTLLDDGCITLSDGHFILGNTGRSHQNYHPDLCSTGGFECHSQVRCSLACTRDGLWPRYQYLYAFCEWKRLPLSWCLPTVLTHSFWSHPT